MLLDIILYIMLAYLMLLASLFTTVCLNNTYLLFKCFLFSCFVFGLLTQFVYFKYYFISCIVPLINWFSYFMFTSFFMIRLCALW